VGLYAILGNHDHDGDVGAQIRFSTSPQNPVLDEKTGQRFWTMPRRFYEKRLNDVHYVFLDTESSDLSLQIQELEPILATSTARWKIVCGHHPLVSDDREWHEGKAEAELLDLVQEHAHLYLAGHDHSVQIHSLSRGKGPLQVICGCSGNAWGVRRYRNARSLMRSDPMMAGFVLLSIGTDRITVKPYQVEPRLNSKPILIGEIAVLESRRIDVNILEKRFETKSRCIIT